MDITKSSAKIKTYTYLNGETVNYSVGFFAVSLLFLIIKQLLKVALGVSAGISAGIAAVIGAVVLFLFERKYVFNNVLRSSNVKQILTYIFRCAVDFGFYKICSFVFVTLLEGEEATAFFITFFIYLFFNYYFDRLIVFDCVKKAANNKNGRCYKLFWENRYLLLSVVLTAIILSVLFLIFSVFPFGDTTVLRMDLYHQYGPLFVELYDRITNFKSFSYSWISGGGSTFLGNYFNYLSSPLSVIILLFDRKEMPYAITTIVSVKGMLCALTFSAYLKFSLKRHSIMTSVFGTFYALSAYFLAYYWNVMWLDGMFLLPLILLGIERIIHYGKPMLYLVCLTVLFFSSYYMAYMTCIFSVVYFCAYYYLKYDLSDLIDKNFQSDKKFSFNVLLNNRFIKSGLLFAGASLLSALLCAVTLIPVYMVLQTSSATSDTFPKSFEVYHDLLNLITSHLAAVETTIRSSGDDVLPNVYCGVLSLMLLPLYIVNKKIKIREKTVYIALVLFFVFGFNNNMANFVWHAFHFPNDLPYRFSFMYTFVILIIAFRTLMNFKGLEYRDIAMSGIFWSFVVILLQKYMTNKMDTKTIYINLLLIMAWTAFLLLLHNHKLSRSILSLALVFFTFCEFCLSAASTIPFSQQFSVYTKNYNTYREAVNHIYESDNGLYRFELSELNTRMDSCLYGYRGISTFSSMAYESYSGTQYSLGMYGNRINSYTYNTQTPLYNMFYAIKYIMKVEESLAPSKDYYDLVYTTKDKKCEVYENKYYLPVAFTASGEISRAEIEEGNPFEAQEELLSKACGISDIYVPVKYVDAEYTDVDCDEVTENGTYYFTRENESESASVDITIKAANSSNLYVYITSPEIENVNYFWGKDGNTANQNIDNPYIMDLGKHKKGEKVTVSIDCGSIEDDSSYFEIYAYNIDYDKLVSAHEMLDEGKLEITSFTDSKIAGKVNAGYNGYLYTSIPYDEGWSIYIDGKKQKNVELLDSQLACKITKGEHTVEMKYVPKGVVYGAIATGTAWAGIAAFFAARFLRKKKKKEEFVEIV